MLICQPIFALPVFAEDTPTTSTEEVTVEIEITEPQKTALIANCTAIHDILTKLQKDDSHARVYLGGRYEKIISKFVTPLNTRLVENSLSTPEMVENQNDLVKAKATFVSDFVDYQRELETLVNMNCQSEPENFYQQLAKVRAKRKTVATDDAKVRSLISDHVKLVTALEEKL